MRGVAVHRARDPARYSVVPSPRVNGYVKDHVVNFIIHEVLELSTCLFSSIDLFIRAFGDPYGETGASHFVGYFTNILDY